LRAERRGVDDMTTKKNRSPTRLSVTALDALIEEATVDAYDTSEQRMGLSTMLENELAVPFTTDVLGTEVTVERVELTDDEEIVAICVRGKARQRVRVVDLPLPSSLPKGWEWVEAYRRWARGAR
jgi:hypothetical protein